MGNLTLAWRRAKENKNSRKDVLEFNKKLIENLLDLHKELLSQTYKPKPLTKFVLRDPKTRVIAKSHFRDRVVHHALINIIKPIFEKQFIYDSCANQLGKGALFALTRFKGFQRKVTKNYTCHGFCLKADIKQYFPNVSHNILLDILAGRIKDRKVIWLINSILENGADEKGKGMPLGNYTSQFLANVYLHKLDIFVKHFLKAKYYIRYVDDFVLMHNSKKQVRLWMAEISSFLVNKLKIELHSTKSKIYSLHQVIDFVGFRNFTKHKLVRVRNIHSMEQKVSQYEEGKRNFENIFEVYNGWQAYAIWGNTHKLREKIKFKIAEILMNRI